MLLSLQYLRGVAALLVVYFHALTQLKSGGNENIYLPLLGESGVDLFFVLSGFVMWITTANKNIGFFKFLEKRIKRIVPIYWILTILASSLALVLGDLMKSTVFDMSHLIKSLFFIPAINPSEKVAGIYPVIIPGWTLNFEFFFYLIFGFSLFFTSRKVRLISVSLLIISLFSFSFVIEIDTAIITFYLNNVIIEFLFGLVLGVLYLKNKVDLKIGKFILLLLIASTSLLLLYADYLSDSLRGLFLGLPSVLLIYWLLIYENNHGIFKSKILKIIGDASYSIYLTHVFVLAGLRVFFSSFSFDMYQVDPAFFVVTAVTSSILIGISFYILIEKQVITILNH